VTTYKSLVLSQIISNVITLCSTTKKVKDEMVSIQNRFLKTIGIYDKEELEKHKIVTIEELIEKHGRQTLIRILVNAEHPVTKSLQKRDTVTRNKFPFKIDKCNNEKYQNSFLQQYLRVLEKEGFTTNTATDKNQKTQTSKETTVCETCKKSFKNTRGLNQHIRMIHTYKK